MQLGQLLAAINATPAVAANASAVSNAGADDASPNQTFAQLLGDAGAKNAASDQGKPRASDVPDQEADGKSVAASTALVAQELNGAADADQPITPDEAGAMLARLDSKDMVGPFVDKLKQALIAIRDGSSKESIASLTQKLSDAQHAASPADIAQVVQALQVLEADQPVVDSADEGKTPDEVVDADTGILSALAQSLQASFFRTVDGKSHAAPAHTAQPERKREAAEIVEIIPLSAILVTNAPAMPAPLQGATSAIEPERDMLIGAGNGAATMALLPEVSLPKAVKAAPVAVKNDETFDALNALKSTNDSRLNAALDAAHASLSKPTKDNAVLRTDASPSTLAASAGDVLATAKAVVNPVAVPVAQAPVAETTATTTTAATSASSSTGMQSLGALRADANAQATTAAPVVAQKASEEKLADVNVEKSSTEFSLNGAIPQAHVANNAAPAAAAKMAAYTPIPVPEQVHVAVSRAAKNGIQDVTIQLDPVDLGRVEVKMHTGADGQTQIAFMVDKPSTLDSLARSAHGLERSLQEAGVKTDSGSMQFNLRQQPQSADTNAGGNGARQSFNQSANEDGIAPIGSTNTAAISAVTTRNYTLNIRDGLDIRA